MFKKLFCFSVSVLLAVFCVSQARAERSADVYSGKKYYEQVVTVDAYNNSGADIAANHIVILDTTGSRGDSLGAYITTSSTSHTPYVIGVADEVITNATSGTVCIRGPHKVLTTSQTVTAGLVLVQSGTTGLARTLSLTDKGSTIGQIGIAIGEETTNNWWVWIDPKREKIIY